MKFRFAALKLVALCVVVFILQQLFQNFTGLFLLNQQAFQQPWRFVTAIFLHANLAHLLYNAFALALFGSILERSTGARKFFLIFFATGVIANLVAINFYSSSLGASGAIFGVIGSLIILNPRLVVWAFGVPMPLYLAGIVWAGIDVFGIIEPGTTASIAHLAGLATGLLFGLLFRGKHTEQPPLQKKIVLNEEFMRAWEDNYLR